MENQFRCKNERRRIKVAGQNAINGIDYLEVASADQKTLNVSFLLFLPGQPDEVPSGGAALTKNNVRIEGGARVRDIQVKSVSATDNVLTVVVTDRGDFCNYTLRIVASPTSAAPPPGFDPQLSAVDFSFKVECPTDFDCQQTAVCLPDKLTEPDINYLAKDYASFRRLILDRLSAILPAWRERNPADSQIALVEMLAYAGDHLSYFQDAVATEAYLGTARRRISVRRHARALDYFIHDGTNARVWVSIEIPQGSGAHGKMLPAGTRLLTRGSDAKVAVADADLDKALAEQPTVFETVHDLALNSAHTSISFYTWSDTECCLPKGSTRATLLDGPLLALKPGDVLIFEEGLSPTTGNPADADPSHKQAVRLKSVEKRVDPLQSGDPPGTKPVLDIEWLGDDALAFPLCLTAIVPDESGKPVEREISIARGNVVLADHGLTLNGESLIPPVVPESGDYRPQLRLGDISFRVAYNDQTARQMSAAGALDQDPRGALPVVSLGNGGEQWEARRDLLNSDRFATDFVVEMERDLTAHLRFGDDLIAGKKPDGGTTLVASYRVGNGLAGNIGAEALARVVTDLNGIDRVRNPMPARGGDDPETMEEVRQFAPQAFRTQQRAVTEADWAVVAQRHPQVQKAAARFRWFGSWYTVSITIDRKGGLPVKRDPRFLQEIRQHLEQFRVAGYDLEINDPVPVPLDIVLTICVKPGYFRSNVKEALLRVFSRFDLQDGGRGFFHPDNFTFGQPVYLSRIYQTALSVAGVASAEAKTFKRFGRLPNNEIDNAAITPAPLEIVKLDNDPSLRENGRIDFDMQGGL